VDFPSYAITAGGTVSVSSVSVWPSFVYNPNASKDSYRARIRSQLSFIDTTNHLGKQKRAFDKGANFENAGRSEIVALHLLKKMVSNDDFKKYLKYGSVSVKGDSGLVYDIKRDDHYVHVYKQGHLVSNLCVYVHDRSVPPTDNVIAKMIIVQCDEHNIWQRANIYWKGVPESLKTVKRKDFTKETLLRLVA
jgi:hypothetical protein